MSGDKIELFYFSDALDMFRKHPVIVSSAVIAGASLVLLKRYFAGGVCRSKASLAGKTVIVTGANTGIGRETARDLAGRGARVILACRDLTKAERAAAHIRQTTGNDAVCVRVLDLSSLGSVRKFSSEVLATEKHIDVLINNAGIMACPQWQSADGHELQLAVNHLGHFLLTNLLLDRLKQSESARVITVSSLTHKTGKIHWDDLNMSQNYNPWAAYSQSKLANMLFTKELHRRLKDSRVSAFAVHPGVVKTELLKHTYASAPKWKTIVYAPLVWFVFKTPTQGAQTSVYCAVQEGLEQHSGGYFSDCALKSPAPQAEDAADAARLWTLSEQLVGLDTES